MLIGVLNDQKTKGYLPTSKLQTLNKSSQVTY